MIGINMQRSNIESLLRLWDPDPLHTIQAAEYVHRLYKLLFKRRTSLWPQDHITRDTLIKVFETNI